MVDLDDEDSAPPPKRVKLADDERCEPTEHTWPLPDTTERVPWTEEQAILNEPPALGQDRKYAATAGAGKTCILIECLIRALSPPINADPHHCLVTAFNNSAAAEIQDRLQARLARQPPSHPKAGGISRVSHDRHHHPRVCPLGGSAASAG